MLEVSPPQIEFRNVRLGKVRCRVLCTAYRPLYRAGMHEQPLTSFAGTSESAHSHKQSIYHCGGEYSRWQLRQVVSASVQAQAEAKAEL